MNQSLTGLEQHEGVSCVDEYDEMAAVSECLRWAGPMPSRFRSCWVPCRDDCTFSSWSKVSECSGCGSRHTRKRTLTEYLNLVVWN
ncbi:hypothetical protein PO909_033552 [Leuciscus waleckii]